MPRLLALFLSLVAALVFACAQPIDPILEIASTTQTLASGTGVQLSVIRSFPGGRVDDVTGRVQYESSNPSRLAVTKAGMVHAGTEEGTAFIEVSDPESSAVATLAFTVFAARLVELSIEPAGGAVVRPGERATLHARGRGNDGETRDVTTEIAWSSSSETIARIEGPGVVVGVANGDAIVTARDPASGVEARATVFVRGGVATLVAIVVTPNPGFVPLGGTTQFTALGIMSDGASSPVTDEVVWSSSSPTVLTIDASGLARGVAAGSATVSAKRAETGAVGSSAVTVQ